MCANEVTSHLRSDDASRAFDGLEVTASRVAGDGACQDGLFPPMKSNALSLNLSLVSLMRDIRLPPPDK